MNKSLNEIIKKCVTCYLLAAALGVVYLYVEVSYAVAAHVVKQREKTQMDEMVRLHLLSTGFLK